MRCCFFMCAVEPGGGSLLAAGSWAPGKNELATIRYVLAAPIFLSLSPTEALTLSTHRARAARISSTTRRACARSSPPRHSSHILVSRLRIRRARGGAYSVWRMSSRSRPKASTKRTSLVIPPLIYLSPLKPKFCALHQEHRFIEVSVIRCRSQVRSLFQSLPFLNKWFTSSSIERRSGSQTSRSSEPILGRS